MHQTLNTNDFGKLTILPNGSVYSNVNMEPLGTIENTVYSLVYKEITKGQSWFRIRDQAPCYDCVYQWLCPSPSNYELVIGKPDLCHIKP
jgi:pseudo-rSAM protein